MPAFKIYADESEGEWNTLNFFKHKSNVAATSMNSPKIETLTYSTITHRSPDEIK